MVFAKAWRKEVYFPAFTNTCSLGLSLFLPTSIAKTDNNNYLKINWDKWIYRDRGTLLFGGYLLCIAGLVMLFIRYKQPKPQSMVDFKLVTGKLYNSSFIDGSKGYHNYTFRLDNCTNSFKIKTAFLDHLNVPDFKQLNEGDSLTVGISTTDTNRLNSTTEYLFVYLIKTNCETFLDSKDTIAFQNSKNEYYYFSGLIALGLAFIYFGYKSKIKTRT